MRRWLLLLALLWAGPAQAVCTLDAAHKGTNLTLSGGNLTFTSSTGSNSSVIGTAGLLAGTGSTNAAYLRYFEATAVAVGTVGPSVGIANSAQVISNWVGEGTGTAIGISAFKNGIVYYLNGSLTTIFTFANADVIGVAVDFFHQKLWWTKNGTTWNNDILANQNPATNTGGVNTASNTPFGTTGSYATVYPAFSNADSGDSMTANFIGPFAYSVPSGFSAWCAAAVTTRPNFFLVTP